jgi:hypothetical protein
MGLGTHLSAVHFERGVGDGDRLSWSGLGDLLTPTVGTRVGRQRCTRQLAFQEHERAA